MPLFVCGSTAHIDARDNRCRYSRLHSIYIRVSASASFLCLLLSAISLWRVSVTQMPQISHKWRKYAWQNNTNIVAIAAPMLPRQCHSRCQHEYESNGPRSRRAFEVLICQANGPNVVNVRAKIKRPSAIGSKIVTGTSSPLQIEGGR